jgi:hypothetical protein
LINLLNKGDGYYNVYNKVDNIISKMESSSSKIQKKNLDSSPDDTRDFEKGKVEIVNFGNVTIGRAIFEPGWSWSKCVKPIVNTNSCQAPHTQYVISGRLKVVMDDGTEEEFGPGDAAIIPPGHDAWVVGNESVVAIDFTGLKDYAKK